MVRRLVSSRLVVVRSSACVCVSVCLCICGLCCVCGLACVDQPPTGPCTALWPFGEVSSRCGSVLWLVAPSGVSLTSLAVLGRVIPALHDSIARLLRGWEGVAGACTGAKERIMGNFRNVTRTFRTKGRHTPQVVGGVGRKWERDDGMGTIKKCQTRRRLTKPNQTSNRRTRHLELRWTKRACRSSCP